MKLNINAFDLNLSTWAIVEEQAYGFVRAASYQMMTGLEVSYETVRHWVLKFGHSYAKRLRRFRPRPDDRWHLDEMFLKISGRRVYLWRAVDAEGEVLDCLVQSKRNKTAALKLMRKLLKKRGRRGQIRHRSITQTLPAQWHRRHRANDGNRGRHNRVQSATEQTRLELTPKSTPRIAGHPSSRDSDVTIGRV